MLRQPCFVIGSIAVLLLTTGCAYRSEASCTKSRTKSEISIVYRRSAEQ